MATFDDFDGVYFTIQALKMYHADVLDQIELLVIDNNPKSEHGNHVKALLSEWGTPSMRKYVAFEESTGTSQTRNKVFEEANGEHVLCLDCHVLMWPDSIKKLLDYYEKNPDCKDMLTGPIVYDNLNSYATHFDPVWREEMWGIWSTAWEDQLGQQFCIRPFMSKNNQLCGFHDLMDGRKLDSLGGKPAPAVGYAAHQGELEKLGFIQKAKSEFDEPFEVPAQGLGIFSCKKSEWLGFNKNFRGFGGEECYIHEKYRQAGRKNICLPFLRWNHRFGRPGGIPYPLNRHLKIRNYVLGHQELGLDLAPVYQHFVTEKRYSKYEWDKLVIDPVGMLDNATLPVSDNGLCQPSKDVMSLEDLYNWAETNPRDINEHFPVIREYAERCEHITEFTEQRESTICLLASQPLKMVSYQNESDMFLTKLQEILPNQGFPVTWELNAPLTPENAQHNLNRKSIEETDILFIDVFKNKISFLERMKAFHKNVSKYIIVHDSLKFAEIGDDQSAGLKYGIREFVAANPEWFIVKYENKQGGLVILSKVQDERPEKIIHPWAPDYGCGTELKKVLKKIGIEATPDCACNARAVQMDFNGSEWCKENKELILDWLKEEADRRKTIFSRTAAGLMLALVIRRGAKIEKRVQKELDEKVMALV